MGPLRDGVSDDEMKSLISDIWNNRIDRYSEIRSSLTNSAQRKVEMYQIGG
jgi:cyclic pyranopterin phosphate synthase